MAGQILLQVEKGRRWWLFRHPRQVVTASNLEDVSQSLARVESAVNERGLYAAGFITYEAAPAFDKALKVTPKGSLPLLWFGLYEEPEIVSSPTSPGSYAFGDWQASIEWPKYSEAIGRIKEHIAEGETYQVNYTFRLRTSFSGNSLGLFVDLIKAQQQAYAAYVDIGNSVICSSSPELFFTLDEECLSGRPMKGTASRGLTAVDDRQQAEWLYNSQKNRAENVMIVDMIRNDMGRVSEIGSVKVPQLFEVEQYPTLWQMTSTVESRTKASITKIVEALFPCASITGAPKVRTMEIIAELEDDPRGIYTGCIGYLAPNRQAQFNVAIRTVVIDKNEGRAEYGVGGGIVWDSDDEEEYEECRIKAQVLTVRRPEFRLLESLLWSPAEDCFLHEEHLQRLADSAAYFGFPLNPDDVTQRLITLFKGLSARPHKVRLLVDRSGQIELEAERIVERTEPLRIALAVEPIDIKDIFLYHKTTKRDFYKNARALCPTFDDVLLWNVQGEVTEATTANVVVVLDGECLTPPVSSGLLAGTFRGRMLGEGKIREKVININDLKRCETIYLINSVRKWQPAILVAPDDRES